MATFLAAYPVLTEPPNVIAAVLLILLIATVLLRRNRKSWLSRIQRKAMLTANETEFFHRLQRALSGYHVLIPAANK